MRFTVRRPAGAEVSPCCHRPSGGDVACSVHVGVARPGVAGCALENRLALAVSGATCPHAEHRCDVYAAGICSTRPEALCCSRTASRPHPLRLMARLSPRFCATRTPGCCSVPRAVRVIARTSRASMRIVSKRRAMSVVAFSTQSLRRSVSRAFSFAMRELRASSPVGAALGAGQPLLQHLQPLRLTRGETGGVQQFAGRQGRRHHHTTVDTHHAALTRTSDGSRDVGERDMPAAGPVTGDPVGLHPRWDRPRTAEAHPAEFGHPHPTEPAIHTLDVMRFDRRPAGIPRAHRLCARLGGGAFRRRSCPSPERSPATPAAARSASPAASQSCSARAAVN